MKSFNQKKKETNTIGVNGATWWDNILVIEIIKAVMRAAHSYFRSNASLLINNGL